MKVKMFNKEWEVNNPTYKEKRELWKLNATTFDGENVNQDNYFKLLDKVEEISGLSEKDFVHKDKSLLSMAEIDLLLQEVFASYMGTEKKDS